MNNLGARRWRTFPHTGRQRCAETIAVFRARFASVGIRDGSTRIYSACPRKCPHVQYDVGRECGLLQYLSASSAGSRARDAGVPLSVRGGGHDWFKVKP
jgi:hypothetical protein